MNNKFLFTLCSLLLVLCPAVGFAESLFIMGWDGAGMNNIAPLLEQGRLPNLQSLIGSGASLVHIEPITMTCTVPNWTTMFTGLTYDQSGVKTNLNWSHVLDYRETIIKSIQRNGHAVGWFTSKGFLSNDHTITPLAKIPNHADSYTMKHPAVYMDKYGDKLTEKTMSFILGRQDYIVFLHINPDYYGHLYGENSERYLHEFKRADYWLGKILPYIDRNNTKIIVISDHGLDEGLKGHYDAPDNFMVTDLPLKEFYKTGETTGTMRDVANTILDYFGLCCPKSMRGKSLLNHE